LTIKSGFYGLAGVPGVTQRTFRAFFRVPAAIYARPDTSPERTRMPLCKRTLSEFLFRRFVLKHYASNLLVDMNLEAKHDTLEYIKAHMPGAPCFEKHAALVSYALDPNVPANCQTAENAR
jgi:hypothetical protein